MAKLVYSAGNLTKSISCVDTSLVNKPYISINGQGCIPLTAQTSTGIKVQINGQEYSPISTMLSTKATTITQTWTYHEGDIGESKTTSWYTSHQIGKSARAYNGNVNVTSYYGNDRTIVSQNTSLCNGYTKLLNMTSYTEEYPSEETTLKTSDGYSYIGGHKEYWMNTDSRINNSIQAIMAPYGTLPLNFIYTSYNPPFIILNTSVHDIGFVSGVTSSFLKYNSAANTYKNISYIGDINNNVLTYYGVRFGIASGSNWEGRSVRTSADYYGKSYSVSYMINQKEGFTHYGIADTYSSGNIAKVSYRTSTDNYASYNYIGGTITKIEIQFGFNSRNFSANNATISIDRNTTFSISYIDNNDNTHQITTTTNSMVLDEIKVKASPYMGAFFTTNITEYNVGFVNVPIYNSTDRFVTSSYYNMPPDGIFSGYADTSMFCRKTFNSGTITYIKCNFIPNLFINANSIDVQYNSVYGSYYMHANVDNIVSKHFSYDTTSFDNAKSTYFVDTKPIQTGSFSYTAVTTFIKSL